METQIINILHPVIGLAVGLGAGWAFGLVQQAALRRHQKRQQGGNSIGVMSIMPGSMSRVAFFLIVLALIQLLFPALFVGSAKWWVSGGVAMGYGTLLFKQLRAGSV